MRTFIFKVVDDEEGTTDVYFIETGNLNNAKHKLLQHINEENGYADDNNGIETDIDRDDLEYMIREVYMFDKTGGTWFYFDPEGMITDSRIGTKIIKIE